MEEKRTVTVSQAARILSVTTKTIRRWDAKLRPQRDGNGYRVYDADALLKTLRGKAKPPRRRGNLDTLHLGTCENMRAVRDRSVNLIFTSPPYPHACRAGLRANDWVQWFMPKAARSVSSTSALACNTPTSGRMTSTKALRAPTLACRAA